MFSREGLWRRLSGGEVWPLAWALAGASALPWVVPESWDGVLPLAWHLAGWGALLATLPLLRRPRLAFLPLGLALAWATLGGLAREARRDAARPTGWVRVEGRISAPWTLQGDRRRGELEARVPASLKGTRIPLSLPVEGAEPPAVGTPVRLHAELVPVEPAPSFLGERPLWRARSEGRTRRAHLASAQLLEPSGPPGPTLLERARQAVWTRFRALDLPVGPSRDLWGALTLGIPPAQEEVFSVFAESGTIHTLVVSGLQVTLVMAAAEALLRRLLGRRAAWAALGAGLAYSALVGWTAPVWRGLAMGAGWVLGRGSGWKLPPALTLHGALLIWWMGHPAAGAEAGFLLAWWALLGLFWGAEPLAGLLAPLLGPWASAAGRALAPWLSTLPLLALLHGGAPLWGAVANLILIPLVGLLTPLCLALTLLPLPGARAVGALLNGISGLLLPHFAAIRPLATGLLAPWILLLLGWIWLAQRWSRLGRCRALVLGLGAGSLALLVSRGTGTAPTTLSLEGIDVGQGDALLLRVPGGEATLVDTGPDPWAARRIVRVLSRRGVREPLRLLLTHPHGDHAGGWATLARLWPPGATDLPVLEASEDPWAPWRPPGTAQAGALRRGDGWSSGEARFSIRWPPKPFHLPDANMVSLVARVDWRDRELWLMGDALAMQERDLLDLGDPGPPLRHRLLKAGHHGSRSSSDPAWIAALAPEAVLVTAGRRNRFGHPHEETLRTLQDLRLPEPWNVGPALGLRVEAEPGGWRWEEGRGRSGLISLRTPPPPSGPR